MPLFMMRVLIVGGGIGGLALAKFLEKKKIDYLIIEKAKKFKSIGYVLGLWPNAGAMLKKLRVYKEIKEKSIVLPYFELQSADGKALGRESLAKVCKGYGRVIETERDTIHRALRKLVKKSKMHMGVTVKKLIQLDDGIEVQFSNGKKETFDLVVGADGINSQIREYVVPKKDVDYTGRTFWMFWCKKTKNLPKGVVYQAGEESLLSIFPTKSKKGYTIGLSMAAKPHYCEKDSDFSKTIKDRFSFMKGSAPKIINSLPKRPSEMYHHDDDEMHLSEWHKGRIVLMGDSCHALSPLMGMGAAMALESAYVLAEELANNDSIPKSLAAYKKRRLPRIKKLVIASKIIHLTVFQIPKSLEIVRDNYLGKIMLAQYMKLLRKFLGEKI